MPIVLQAWRASAARLWLLGLLLPALLASDVRARNPAPPPLQKRSAARQHERPGFQDCRRGLFRRLRGRRCGSESAAAPQPSKRAPETAPAQVTPAETTPSDSIPSPSDLPQASAWQPLLGDSLEGWKITPFGGEGEVFVEEGVLTLGTGDPMTGVNYTGTTPLTNYEVEFQAQRVSGIDFFCGFTFPVKDSHCSFIVGGWAGGIVGLSCIDGLDASENSTTRYMSFDNNRWYQMRVRVTDTRISAWIDDQQVVSQDIRDRRISTRTEVDASRPFGFATWQTKGALKDIRLRPLAADEL
jgi:hypothetical protein